MTPDQKFLFDQLTNLQQAFCTNILAGMLRRDAYRLAGGKAVKDSSADTYASLLISNPKIKAFLDAMKEASVTEAVMKRTEALEKLSDMARTDLKDLVDFGEYEIGIDEESGNPIIQASWKLKPQALQDPRRMAAISELSASKDGLKIKTHSPIEAIKQLAKMQGWEAAKKLDLTSTDGTMSPQKGRSLDDFYTDMANGKTPE